MIEVESGIQLGISTQRLLRRLSLKSYDVVIGTKRSSDPLSRKVIPRQPSSAGRPTERPCSSHSASSQKLLIESKSGSLMNWDKSLTLRLKSWFRSNLGLSIDHLVRTNDLGLKTAKGVSAVGVILLASHTTESGLDSVRSGSVLVISSSSWSALQTEIGQFARSRQMRICILDSQGNIINFI